MTYCKLLLCSALLLNFCFFAFSLNVSLSFTWLMMFHKWAILSAWVCYLTQLRVFSDALWTRCTVCIEYSPIHLNYLKPWTCVYLRYTSGTALRDTRTVGRYRTIVGNRKWLSVWWSVLISQTYLAMINIFQISHTQGNKVFLDIDIWLLMESWFLLSVTFYWFIYIEIITHTYQNSRKQSPQHLKPSCVLFPESIL